jgi:hypothetical protein
LTNHPDVQHKLRASVLSAVPEIADRLPTFEEMNAERIPYLEAVVQEMLRVSVIAPALSREGKCIVVYLVVICFRLVQRCAR